MPFKNDCECCELMFSLDGCDVLKNKDRNPTEYKFRYGDNGLDYRMFTERYIREGDFEKRSDVANVPAGMKDWLYAARAALKVREQYKCEEA